MAESARDIGKDNLLVFEFTASDGSTGRGHHALTPYKRMALTDPELTVGKDIKDGALTVTIEAKKLALLFR